MSNEPQKAYQNYRSEFTTAEEKAYSQADTIEEMVWSHHEFRTKNLSETNVRAAIAAEQSLIFAARAHFYAFESLRMNRKILVSVRIILLLVLTSTLFQIWQV